MSEAMRISIWIAQALVCVAAALTLVRMWRGPSLMDRLLALDFLSLLIIALALLEGVFGDARKLLAPAMGLALVSFIATVAFARLLEGHGMREDDDG